MPPKQQTDITTAPAVMTARADQITTKFGIITIYNRDNFGEWKRTCEGAFAMCDAWPYANGTLPLPSRLGPNPDPNYAESRQNVMNGSMCIYS